MKRDFANGLAYGQMVERRIVERLVAGGHAVIPTFAAGGVVTAAPVLLAACGQKVMPDVLCMGKRVCWVEIKGKSEPGWYRILQRWEHGIDMALIDEYAAVQGITGKPVWIVVHEECGPVDPARESRLTTGAAQTLCSSLDRLTDIGEHRPTWPGGKHRPDDRGRDGMGGWLWARADMRRFTVGGRCD